MPEREKIIVVLKDSRLQICHLTRSYSGKICRVNNLFVWRLGEIVIASFFYKEPDTTPGKRENFKRFKLKFIDDSKSIHHVILSFNILYNVVLIF